MEMFHKHKKKDIDGFREFVLFFEQLSVAKQELILDVGILEDPLYLSWITRNMLTFLSLFELDQNDFNKIIPLIPNKFITLAKAFYKKTPEETELLARFPQTWIKQYKEEFELLKDMRINMQENSQALIIQSIRKHIKLIDYKKLSWKIPPIEIVTLQRNPLKDGTYEICYDNGNLAMAGDLEKYRRHGYWEFYFEDGNIATQGVYNQGLKEGSWSFYNKNCALKACGQFHQDHKEGPWEEWNREGIKKNKKYHRGKLESFD